ncbi:unnamed protein product, partial [Polarella glacialis]
GPSEKSRAVIAKASGEVQRQHSSEGSQESLEMVHHHHQHQQQQQQGQQQSHLRVISIDQKVLREGKQSLEGSWVEEADYAPVSSATLFFGPVLSPALLELSSEQEDFRREYRQARNGRSQNPGDFKVARATRGKRPLHDGARPFEDCRPESPKPRKMSVAWAEQRKSLTGESPVTEELHVGTPWWLSVWGFQDGHRRRSIAIAMSLYTAAMLCCIGVSMATQFWRFRGPMSKEGRLTFRMPGRDSAMQATSAILMDKHMLPKFVDLWLERSRWLEQLGGCLLVVAIEAAVVTWTHDGDDDCHLPGIVHITAFAVVAGTFSALSLYLLHMCNAQAAMIDHYSATAAETTDDYWQLRHDWDRIQATLRRSAQGLTPCLLTLTFTPLLVVAVSAIELFLDNEYNGHRIMLELLPKLIVLLGALRGLCRIGEVT